MTHRLVLHRPLRHFEPSSRAFVVTAAAASSRPDRVLSDFGRPAVEPGGSVCVRGDPRNRRSRGDGGDIVHVLEASAESASSRAAGTRRNRLGRGASTTCSSTPASTCCRRLSIASSRRGRQLPYGFRRLDDRSGSPRSAEAIAARNPKPIASSGTTGRSRSFRIGRGAGAPAASERTRPRGNAASHRIEDSTCPPAAARTWPEPERSASIAVTGWERFRGGPRLDSCAGARAGLFRTLRDTSTAPCAISVLPEELRSAIERLQAEAKELRRSAICRSRARTCDDRSR